MKRSAALLIAFGILGILRALWGMEAVYGFLVATVIAWLAWYRTTGKLPGFD